MTKLCIQIIIRSIAKDLILIGFKDHIPTDSTRVFSQTITSCARGFVNHNVFQCRPSQQWCTRVSRHDWLAPGTGSLAETSPGAVAYWWGKSRWRRLNRNKWKEKGSPRHTWQSHTGITKSKEAQPTRRRDTTTHVTSTTTSLQPLRRKQNGNYTGNN